VFAGVLALADAKDEVLIDVNASTWESGVPQGPGLIPIEGSGQVNGGFTLCVDDEVGVQIGIRAQLRYKGPIHPVPDSKGKEGIYTVPLGADENGEALWNYDVHVDLRPDAQDPLGDYELIFDSDIWDGKDRACDMKLPIDLAEYVPGDTLLVQESWNPVFCNPDFDPTKKDTYEIDLELKEKKDSGKTKLKCKIEIIAQ
jgi:hypothetical protein